MEIDSRTHVPVLMGLLVTGVEGNFLPEHFQGYFKLFVLFEVHIDALQLPWPPCRLDPLSPQQYPRRSHFSPRSHACPFPFPYPWPWQLCSRLISTGNKFFTLY